MRAYRPQIVAALSFTQNYGANDSFTVNFEYFYNGLGYPNADVYPG